MKRRELSDNDNYIGFINNQDMCDAIGWFTELSVVHRCYSWLETFRIPNLSEYYSNFGWALLQGLDDFEDKYP